MGLDVPDLDDREYEALMDEARKLLPAYSAEWTNFNPQDPGITVLETLAWLTDSYVYQLDSVTDAHRRKYLQLMGDRPRPPTAASTRLSLDAPADAAGLRVPEGAQLTVVDGSDAEKTFETDEAVVLTDAALGAVVTIDGTGVTSDGAGVTSEGSGVSSDSAGVTDQSHTNDTPGMYYRPLGDDPEPGDAVALGLDGDPFADADRCSITVDFHDENLPEPASHGSEPPTFDPSVELVWEYCTDYGSPDEAGGDAWQPFDVVRDDTDSFYRGGTVTLAAPDEWDPAGWGSDDAGLFGTSPGLVWIRCRVATAGYEIPPQFDAVSLGVVPASNRRTVAGEPLDRVRGTGGPAGLTTQRYRFAHAPVIEAEISVDGEPWTEVADFDASGPTDPHYVLDAAEGVVRFGDGVRGKVPEPDQRVVAERYVAVDGAAGNVPTSASWRFAEDETAADGASLSDVTVTPRRAATGGTDAESLDDAFRRVKRDLQTPSRAVTADDIEHLALHTPGLRVGRARALMVDRASVDGREAGSASGGRATGIGGRTAGSGGGRTAGGTGGRATGGATGGRAAGSAADAPPEARVVVVPYAPADVSRPTPSEGFLAAVQAHLDEHRLLTDRVRAVPPTYVGISVTLEVRATDGRPGPGGEATIESAVRRYLDPIHGADGDGWPFGGTLYAESLAEAVAGVEWVDGVEHLSVTAPGNARVDPDGNVRIDDGSLFALADVAVDVGAGPRRDGNGGA